jgi:pimeloyl-ACP methyl ester carboxylesterase
VSRGLVLGLVFATALALDARDASAYAIGHRSVTHQDPARGNRSILTEIYYPSDTAGDNVPVASGIFPVIAFGHGYLLPWDAYAWVWSALAPEGFILALPRTEGSLFPSHAEFGKDLAFLVAKLRAEGSNAGSPFYQRVAEEAAVMGHSMGGGASFLAAAEDPTIDAVANFAAAETNPSAIAAASGLSIPGLLFAGSNDCVTPPADHQIPMYEALPPVCKAYVNLTGASHCQFAAYNFTCGLGEGSCPSPMLSRSEQQAIVIEYLLSWLRAHLEGDGASWIAFETLLASDARTTYLEECALTGVAAGPSEAPPAQALSLTARPNPFNPSTTILLTLPAPVRGRVLVHDASGRLVRTLFEGPLPSGTVLIVWDGSDDADKISPSGVYFARIEAGGAARTAKLVLVR